MATPVLTWEWHELTPTILSIESKITKSTKWAMTHSGPARPLSSRTPLALNFLEIAEGTVSFSWYSMSVDRWHVGFWRLASWANSEDQLETNFVSKHL